MTQGGETSGISWRWASASSARERFMIARWARVLVLAGLLGGLAACEGLLPGRRSAAEPLHTDAQEHIR